MAFRRIERVELPERVVEGEGFQLRMHTDGPVPFAQTILRHDDGWEWIVRDERVVAEEETTLRFDVPPEAYHAGPAHLQVEGCRAADPDEAEAGDWETVYCDVEVQPAAGPQGRAADEETMIGEAAAGAGEDASPDGETAAAPEDAAPGADASGRTPRAAAERASVPPEEAEVPQPPAEELPRPAVELGRSREPVLYFGIHKHMHQPYYNATDPEAWDGEKDEIFGSRAGCYTRFLPAAVRQYMAGNLPHAGLSTSWSGSLIEQLNRAAETGRAGGAFQDWSRELRQLAGETTASGHPRVDFTAFGFYHPLMPLIPHRDVVGQIEWHRRILRETFGQEAGPVLFPPETAFHPHLIPALLEAGVEAVIFDTIHRFRATEGYPYAGPEEGMLPPNPAEQENPPVADWLQLNGIWAPSRVSPAQLAPCLLSYTDAEGQRHEITGVPAERYLGNEDARGGYGALQYEQVMGQLLERLVETGGFDPEHPPFFVLHSDGDNHGGGAESYYTCNTAGLVRMCQNDPRFQLVTIRDYLQAFPVDPANVVHVEPGAWAGADNGDPQFRKWFSREGEAYSPDLNSWAVLTAFQNVVHSLEDAGQERELLDGLKRLLYTAETSCYWYWTGQEVWDRQVTDAANEGLRRARAAVANLQDFAGDITGPTVFPPWHRPPNPGGRDWGPNGELIDAAPEATIRTFVHDVSGVERVTLHVLTVGGFSREVAMEDLGPYPSQTDPDLIARQYRALLPPGTGEIRYFVEAVDRRGNVTRSPVSRVAIP